jgi:sporulation protein YlmC with PRC-barrel domain
MKMRYRELIGMPVYFADGSRAGKVASLIAQRDGSSLCVTALIVGPSGLLGRIGVDGRHARRIAWSQVARIDGSIYLKSPPDATVPGEAGSA